MPKMIPCAGYPSRLAACHALFLEGKDTAEIASLTGIARGDVTSMLRNSPARVFARRQQARVAPVEDNHIVAGVLPRAARATRLDPKPERGPRLMREIAAKSTPRYRLRGAGGYVHLSLDGVTPTHDYAWIGFLRELKAVFARKPELKSLSIIKVPPAAPVSHTYVRGAELPRAVRR